MAAKLRLYNTLTRSKDDFVPIDPENVRLYVCGPTVYDYAHIGNARPIIVFDLLFRLLRHVYGRQAVTYVRNITDVDDKINARAARDYPGMPHNEAIRVVTAKTEEQFHADIRALGVLMPEDVNEADQPPRFVEPRATEHIDEMRMIIERLIARGAAYVAEEHVLFSVSAMQNLGGVPKYGAFSKRSLDELLSGARVDVAPYKRDAMDFVLWKPSGPQDPAWPSPAGIATPGRPGWHIECSAMAWRHLVQAFETRLTCADPTEREIFDIHGGGIDLVFPHHENEIAQSCCAFETPRMANVWMHNGFLQVEGEKMAKSLGNFVTIYDLLKTKHGSVLRLTMLKTHYRQPIDWTEKEVLRSEDELREWSQIIEDKAANVSLSHDSPIEVDNVVIEALADDLNTPFVIARLHEIARLAKKDRDAARLLYVTGTWLGLKDLGKSGFFSKVLVSSTLPLDRAEVFHLAMTYRNLSANTQLQTSETFISELKKQNLQFRVDERGTVDGWLTVGESDFVAKVEALIAARKEARASKNWPESDRIRDELAALNVVVKDNKDGTTTWEVAR